MLVNKSMYVDAREIFYSRNRFQFTQEFEYELVGVGSLTPKGLWPNPLSSVRTLEFALNIFEYPTFTQSDDPNLCKWLDIISELKTHANLGGLTIVLHVQTMLAQKPFPLRLVLDHDAGSDGEFGRDMLYQSYLTYIKPLQDLQGLKRLFVSLETERHWSSIDKKRYVEEDWDLSFSKDQIHVIRESLHEMESSLEREVMGDRYNSNAVGKADWCLGIWEPKDRIHTW